MYIFRRSITGFALAAALTVGTLTGCDAVQRAVDCGRLAVAVADSVGELTVAAGDSADAAEMLPLVDSIEKETEKLKEKTGDAEVEAAADSVLDAADNVRTSIESGEEPDLSPLSDATAELTGVCTPE